MLFTVSFNSSDRRAGSSCPPRALMLAATRGSLQVKAKKKKILAEDESLWAPRLT